MTKAIRITGTLLKHAHTVVDVFNYFSMSTIAVGAALALAGGLTYLERNYDILDTLRAFKNINSGNMLTIVRSRGKEFTTADLWYETMSRVPHDKTALINAETGQEYTFAEVEEYSNKVANWALTVGVKSRDVVALFMENRPEYIMVWLGLCKVGAVVALINSNNKKNTLLHALKVGNCSRLIYGIELESVVADVSNDLKHLSVFVSTSGVVVRTSQGIPVGKSMDDGFQWLCKSD